MSLLTIEHMAIFVVKSIVIQIIGQAKGSINSPAGWDSVGHDIAVWRGPDAVRGRWEREWGGPVYTIRESLQGRVGVAVFRLLVTRVEGFLSEHNTDMIIYDMGSFDFRPTKLR